MKEKLFDIENMIYKSKHRHKGTEKKTEEKSISKSTSFMKTTKN
jgi:hypothetical protein